MRCFLLCILHLCVETGPCGSPVITTLPRYGRFVNKTPFPPVIGSWSIKKQCLFRTLFCFNQCTFSHQAFPKTLKEGFCVTEILFYRSWGTKGSQTTNRISEQAAFLRVCIPSFFPEFIWSLREWKKKPMNESERSVVSSSVVSL